MYTEQVSSCRWFWYISLTHVSLCTHTAALVEGVLLQPTLYWKNAQAQQLPFTLNPRTIYRGTAASIFNECQMMGLQFLFTGVCKKFFVSSSASQPGSSEHVSISSESATTTLSTSPSAASPFAAESSDLQDFTAAACGGILSAFFSSPVELIMIQQQRYGGSFPRTALDIISRRHLQASPYLSSADLHPKWGRLGGTSLAGDGLRIGCGTALASGKQGAHGAQVTHSYIRSIMLNLSSVTSGLGSRGMMRGVLPCAVRDCLYTCGLLGITPIVQDHLIKTQGMSQSMAGFYASMLGGIAAAVPSQPFDVVKTCMQGDIKQEKYTTVTHTMTELYHNQGGVSRLFSGCMWRTVNITLTIYIANECRVRLLSTVSELPV